MPATAMLAIFAGAASLATWLYLLLGRGGFWRVHLQRDDADGPFPDPSLPWPSVVAVVPARNEADMIPQSLRSLLAQSYPGDFRVVLVNDHSDDGTVEAARQAAAASMHPQRLTVLPAPALAPGWTGKLWAVSQGVAHACAGPSAPHYLLLTDADIGYAPGALKSLVARAHAQRCVMVSLMAKLRCQSLAERALVPAFIFFFQMLFPFAWVRRAHGRHASTAAAAGGCILVERRALLAAGGIESIRGALIDDCALGARLKREGRIWLGLTERVCSLRPYPDFIDIRHMVARSAYAQLRYSPLLLAGTVLGMAIAYLAAPLLALFGSGPAQWFGALAWAMMAVAYAPTLRFYGLSLAWAPVLPGIAAVYVGFTLDSAWEHAHGRGGMWKGRAQAGASTLTPIPSPAAQERGDEGSPRPRSGRGDGGEGAKSRETT